jgi:hypothetical protein
VTTALKCNLKVKLESKLESMLMLKSVIEETFSRRTTSHKYWFKVLDLDLLRIDKTWHLLMLISSCHILDQKTSRSRDC